MFDELAWWNKRIPDEEILMFMGGYSKFFSFPCYQSCPTESSFDNVDASQLINMMNSVDFNDPDQAATALEVGGMDK